jgi:PhzF family phenazine biosynthesis protein
MRIQRINQLDLYEVNAFSMSQQSFSGSPAAVCLLEKFLPDTVMQSIAAQNNLPETAFIVGKDADYTIRWFAPTQEVNLCGHATLASAHVLFAYFKINAETIHFNSMSGILKATRVDDLIELNFPARPSENIVSPGLILEAINFAPMEVLASDDYIVVLENQTQIKKLEVNLEKLSQLDRRGVIFTAPGEDVDFVSRVFHPKLGIGEDPACGSAHCELMPYWSKRLHKFKLHSYQLASRPAEFFCRIENDRVFLRGRCHTYMLGKIFL